MYRATVRITLRPSILDPQGKVLARALHDLGHAEVAGVRTGKQIELLLDVASADEAERVAQAAASQLLANAVMEDFTVAVEPVAAAAAA